MADLSQLTDAQLLSNVNQIAKMSDEELLSKVNNPLQDRNELSWRQGKPTSRWDDFVNFFGENAEKEKAKAANALSYSEMLNISPSVAYEYHDEISSQVQEKLSTEKIITEKKGITGAAQAGIDNSILGLMSRQQVPKPFESASQVERWINGFTTMAYDLPFFLTGMALGGGPASVSGWAGSFGLPAGIRQVLIDRYTKGEMKDFGEFVDRTGSAIKETIKGQIVGGLTGMAGMVSPIGYKALSELATMTAAGKLIEGHVPTARDFVDNAALLVAMHMGIKGKEVIQQQIPEIKARLREAFVEDGITPKEIKDRIMEEPVLDTKADIDEIIDKVIDDIKSKQPPQEQVKEEAKGGEKVQPEPSLEGVEVPSPRPTGETSIKNAIVDLEREARGKDEIETPIGERPENWKEIVKEKVDSGEMNPHDMARKIKNLVDIGEKVPTLSDEWNIALEYDKKKMQNQYDAIEEAIDKGKSENRDVSELERLRDKLEIDIETNEYATKAIGTEQSHALSSRKEIMAEDYSFAAMLQRAKEDGVKITPEVRDELKIVSKKIKKAQKAVDDLEEGKGKEALDNSIKIIKNEEALKQRKEKRTAKKEELDAEFDELVKEFSKQIGGQLSMGVDPTAVKFMVGMARNRIQKGIVTAEGIVDEIYTALKNAGLEYSKREIRDTISGYGITKEMSKEDVAVKLREAKAQMRLISALEDAQKAEIPLRTGLQRDKPSDRVRELQREVKQAMRESGIDSTKGKSPEEQWKTSLDAVKTRLKNQITDLEKQLKTFEPSPSKEKGIKYDEEALALKDVRDALKGVVEWIEGKKEMSPEQRLRQATAAVEKSIKEYERRIAEKDLEPKKKESKTPETPELKELRAKRDKLKDESDELKKKAKEVDYPNVKKSEAQLKALEKSIAELERRIKEKDFKPAESKSFPTLELPEVAKLREVQEKLRDTLKEMKDAEKPKLTPEQQAQKAFRTRTENQIKELRRRLDEGDFSPKPQKEPRLLSGEELKVKFELDKAKREYAKKRVEHQIAGRSDLQKIGATLIEAINLSRAIKTSFDLSGLLRQGGLLVAGDPTLAPEAMRKMLIALKSPEGEFAVNREILSRKNYHLYEKGKLYLAEHGMKLSDMEEVYMSRWAEKVPGVAASQRAYTTVLNVIRANKFDIMLEKLCKDSHKPTEEELKAIGRFINEFTGRGTVEGREMALVGANTIFFAPRYVLSRFQVLMGHSMWGGTARTRTLIAQEYAKTFAGLAVVVGMGLMMGATLETDPRSSDFMKLKFGNTRVDLFAGLIQSSVLISRVLTEETKTISGRVLPLSGETIPYGGANTWDIISRFIRSKFSPVVGTAVDIKTGKDIVGNKVTMFDIPEKMLVPLAMSDILTAMQDQGIPFGTALGVLSIFGMGLQTYTPGQKQVGAGTKLAQEAGLL